MLNKKALLVLCCLIAISSAVSLFDSLPLNSLRARRQAEDVEPAEANKCDRPPETRGMQWQRCCDLPKKLVWGDLHNSFMACHNEQRELWRQRQAMNETDIESDNPEDRSERPERPDSVGSHPQGRPRFHKRHFMHGQQQEACRIECVFKHENFLTDDNKVDKEALLNRLDETLKDDPKWYTVAAAAVDSCVASVSAPARQVENTNCSRGPLDAFTCILKQMYLNCPNWPEKSQYCNYLKDYYAECPNSHYPPHPHHHHHPHHPHHPHQPPHPHHHGPMPHLNNDDFRSDERI